MPRLDAGHTAQVEPGHSAVATDGKENSVWTACEHQLPRRLGQISNCNQHDIVRPGGGQAKDLHSEWRGFVGNREEQAADVRSVRHVAAQIDRGRLLGSHTYPESRVYD